MTTVGKFWYLLSRPQRRRAGLLFALMLLGMVLETLGVGLIIPAIAFIADTDLASNFPAFTPVLDLLGRPAQSSLMFWGMVLLVVVFAVKTAFLSYLMWFQAQYTGDIQVDLSQRLFTGYLRQPYTFHLQRNSAELNRNISSEVSLFASSIASALLIITEGLVVIGVVGLLVAVQPLGAVLVAVILGLALLVYQAFIRRRVARWGEARQVHETLRIQHLLQGLGAVKDLKVLGREREFLAQFHEHNAGSSYINRRQQTFLQLPRLWLEMLAVVGLATIVLVMLAQRAAPAAILPTIAVFAAAAFRVLPSATRMLSSVQNVRYCLPVLDVLVREFRMLQALELPRRGERLRFERALVLDAVQFRYPATDAPAVRGVTIEVLRGSTVGFIGKTGAGKSTLVDVLLGLLEPTAGAVRVDGVDVRTNIRGWQDQIGYVPQTIYLTDDTLRRNVAFGLPSAEIDEAAAWRALEAAQMAEFVRELPEGLDTVVGERGVRLSGGQRQRVGIARALYHDPAVLVLDEATSSLDTVTERDLMAAIRELHGTKTIVIVAHRLTTVEHCDRVYRLERGLVVDQGTAPAVLKPLSA